MIIEETKYDKLLEDRAILLDFVKSFEKRAYDAWKPVQLFRSDSEVEIDEIKRELLEKINEECKAILEDIGELSDD